MPTSKFLWSTGDVPAGYEVMTLRWAEGKTMSEATDDLRKSADKNGADGIVAIRFTPITTINIRTTAQYGGASQLGNVQGSSATRWVVYGTLVKRK